MYLDPRRFWCLRAYSIRSRHLGAESSNEGTIDLSAADEYPVPRRLVETSNVLLEGNVKRVVRVEKEFDIAERSPLPAEEEFTLSAFGLPEPAGFESVQSKSRWYLWLATIGGACLLVGLLLGRFRKKST